MNFRLPFLLMPIPLLGASALLAQAPPDAGLIHQEIQQEHLSPISPSVDIDLRGEPLTDAAEGGARVELKGIQLSGNQVFSDQQLMAALGNVLDQSYDLSGLQSLANRISLFYRERGYPFARAVLPAQAMDDGVLQVVVIEGRYGEVTTVGDARLAEATRGYLHRLVPGEPVESSALERSMLVMGDLPGIRIAPVMRPGQRHGEGDLSVQVEPDRRVRTQVGANNHGIRFSGAQRAWANVQVNRVLMVGDELNLTALYSSEDTWLGDISYSVPLGYSGLRGTLGYAHTDYTLGKGFEGYTGTAKVASVGLSYPLVRSERVNIVLSATYQQRELDDDAAFIGYNRATDSKTLPLGLRFDARDGLAGGGITYGGVTLTPGQLDVEVLGRTEIDYRFTKATLELARIQALGQHLTLFGRFSGQWSDRDYLDGSENFFLGGPMGVRAYPAGEGSDSEGWLTQFELRYRAARGLAPYLFLDAGRTPNGGIDEGKTRSLSATGLGIRYNLGGLNVDISSAWKIDGGDALSDDRQRNPRIWAAVSYRFGE